MKAWSLRLGRFFGIEVYIHWTFWILIVWVLLMHVASGGIGQGAWGIAFILSLFLCVVIHEFGHALTARRFGIVTHDITLYPIGGIASLEGMPEKPAQELIVAIVGPFVNLGIAAVLLVLLIATGRMPSANALENVTDIVQLPFLYSLLFANLTLAIFNLIPAFPMDGGRALRALLSFWMDRVNATRIAAGLGQAFAILLVFLGFFTNFWLVFIGLFVYLGAGGEAAYARMQSALSGLTVNDALMSRFTVLSPEDTIGKAADALLKSQETEFVTLDAGKPTGLLTRDEIIRGLTEAGPDARVADFASDKFTVVDAGNSLKKLFEELLRAEHPVAIVIRGGEVAGLIDRNNVEEKILINEALTKYAQGHELKFRRT